MKKTLLLAVLASLALGAHPALAQKLQPEWGLGFYAVADNREYDLAQSQMPQSLLGAWLTPEAGLAFDSVHHLRAGAGILRYFGSPDKGIDQLQYTAYYRYHLKPFELYVGSFPARALLADYPAALLYDSIADFRPNMGGVFWRIYGARWHANIWLDWTGHQTYEQRETFLVGIAGSCRLGSFYAAAQSYMNHFAGVMGPANDTLHIVDNGMARLCAGFSLPANAWLDSLNINAGALASYSRERSVDEKYRASTGFIGEITLEKFGLGVKNTLYVGENQMPLYPKYGMQHLYWGDPFYQNKFYNRTDIYVQFFDTDRVQARFTWALHAAEKILSHQQRFTLSVRLDSAQPKGQPRSSRKTLAGWIRG
jgi:hypothetical protein